MVCVCVLWHLSNHHVVVPEGLSDHSTLTLEKYSNLNGSNGHSCLCFSSDVCVPDVDKVMSQRIPDSDGQMSPLSKKKEWRKRGRMDAKEPSGKHVFLFIQLCTASPQPASRSVTHICRNLISTSSLCLQVKSGIPVCAPRTVRTVCAAPVTSGLGSASLCCGRDRFARDTAGRGTTAWSCSSAARAVKDSDAERCESPALGQRRRRRHSWRWRKSQILRLPLPRLATPPPTHRFCPRPQSRLHQQRWQKRDFMCARKTEEGRTDGWKDSEERTEEGRKERRKDLPLCQ